MQNELINPPVVHRAHVLIVQGHGVPEEGDKKQLLVSNPNTAGKQQLGRTGLPSAVPNVTLALS